MTYPPPARRKRFFAVPGHHLLLNPISGLGLAEEAPARVIRFLPPALPARGQARVFGQWRGLDLPFAANSFSRILVHTPFAGLWTLNEVDALFGELWRISAPEGRVALLNRCSPLGGIKLHDGHTIMPARRLQARLARVGFANVAARRLTARPRLSWGARLWCFSGQKRVLRPSGRGVQVRQPAFQPV